MKHSYVRNKTKNYVKRKEDTENTLQEANNYFNISPSFKSSGRIEIKINEGDMANMKTEREREGETD